MNPAWSARVRVLAVWQGLARWPAGGWLFSRCVCLLAPYFSSIGPRVTALDQQSCSVRLRNRRSVRNHLGGIHGIALCNAAEMATAVLLQAALPAGRRWLPTGLSAEFLHAATSDVTATARLASTQRLDKAVEFPVPVDVVDRAGRVVAQVAVRVYVAAA
jgi:uncharacterized protein (TIGR00369 family)